MSEKPTEKVVVTVDDQHVPSIQAVAANLRSAGLQVSHVLPTSGIITGEVAQENLNGLKTVSGVTDVEPDEEMRAICQCPLLWWTFGLPKELFKPDIATDAASRTSPFFRPEGVMFVTTASIPFGCARRFTSDSGNGNSPTVLGGVLPPSLATCVFRAAGKPTGARKRSRF